MMQSVIEVRPCAAACGVNAIRKRFPEKSGNQRAEMRFLRSVHGELPFGAIADKSQIFQLIKAIRSGRKIIAQVAPAFVGQFGPGVTPDMIKTALKQLGFADVYGDGYRR